MLSTKFIPTLIFLLSLTFTCFSQNKQTDSLKILLKNATHDTIRCRVLSEMIQSEGDFTIWAPYNEEMMEIAQKNTEKTNKSKSVFLFFLATGHNNLGEIGYSTSDYSGALVQFHKSLKIFEEIGNKNGMSQAYLNIGAIHRNQGDIKKALSFYEKGLKIAETTNDKKTIAQALHNIGVVYKEQGDMENALIYYQKSLKIREEIKDKTGMAISLNNIGVIYKENKEYDIALEYYRRSLDIKTELGDKSAIATSLSNIGLVYKKMKDLEKALNYYEDALKIREEIGDKSGIANSLNNISSIYIIKKNYKLATTYALRCKQISIEIQSPDIMEGAADKLYKIYSETGNFKGALENYELYITMRDSISNQETRKASIKSQLKYEYDKKAAADSVKVAEEKKVVVVQLKQEKTQRFALYGGLLLVALFSIFMFNRFRVTSKQKKIIEIKEQETHLQKHIIEEKHKEITDSINYAERIQRSFLATKAQLDEYLKDYFVLFQPKDVVSGDFYWSHKLKNGNFVLVTADSTGHGVPGAIMSLLNTSSLEKAVELGISEPAEILNHTRQTIIQRLKKDGSAEGGKDGMDCSLISFNKDKTKLMYSAANNPIWIVRQNELIELKSDKMPVGKHDKDSVSFTQYEVDLQTGDMIYALTDGYPDQFGGPKGKKFMYKKLKEILISIAHKPTAEQQPILKDALTNWMGDTEQVDDITIIGVRV